MKVMINTLIAKLFLLAALFSLALSGQAQDSIPERVINNEPLAVEMPNTFDFIFQRDFLVGNGDEDTASIRGGGSWFIGLGFKIPLADNRFGFRISPGINWLKINYDHTDTDKAFPIIGDTVVSNLYPDLSTITDPEARALAKEQLDALAARLRNVDYELQRHRFTYVEVPVGIYVNLTRDENRKAEAFVEGGGIFGYNLSNIFKYRYQNRDDLSQQNRVNEVPDVTSFRFGWYGRLGYKRFSATLTYRNSYLFDFEDTLGEHKFPQMQLGVTFML